MRKPMLLASVPVLLGLIAALVFLLSVGSGDPAAVYAQGPDGYGTYHVAPGADYNGAVPCYDTVQQAVDAADAADDVVKVAEGHYIEVSVRGSVPAA